MTDPKPPTRTLLIEITDQDGGTREVYEPDDELMREMGFVRADASKTTTGAPLTSIGELLSGPIMLPYSRDRQAEAITAPGVELSNGNGTNGHAIPDLVVTTLPAESAIKREDHADPVRVMGANGRQIDEALTGEPIAMTEHGEKMYGARGPSLTPLEVLNGVVSAKAAAGCVPLSELVSECRARTFSGNARNSGDVALEVVSSLIHVLEAERKAGA